MTQEPDWNDVEAAAVARATAALHEDMSTDELVAVMRQLGDDYHRIPPRKRAVDTLGDAAARLVAVLTDAGVEFADRNNAPAQLAASMLAAWMHCERVARDGGDWAEVCAALPDAIEWARWNGTDAEPWAREIVQRHVDGPTS